MKTLKTSILVIVIIFINLMTLLSIPPGWEVVDVRYDIPDGYKDNTYVEIACADSANCFIWNEFNAAGGYYFRRTTDGGLTWKNMYMDSAYIYDENNYYFVPDINEIAYPNEKLFIAVGDSGLVVRTTDKGETWESYRLDKKVRLFWLRMLDENYGIVFKREYFGDRELNILETTDGGLTWSEMNYVDDGGISFQDIDVISRNQITAIIFDRISNPENKEKKILMVYNDWEYCDSLYMPKGAMFINFVNENEGWVAGGYFYSTHYMDSTQEIYYTSDGGKNWIEQRNRPYENDKGFTISGLDMYDENYGIAKSNEAFLLITTDGGKNWQENQLVNIDYTTGSSYPISSLCAPSPTTAYAILQGDTVYKYTREISDVYDNEQHLSNLHPNPATSQITLSLGEEFVSEPEIDVVDYLGNVMRWTPSSRWSPSDKSITINTSSLSPGVYFLRVRSGEKVEVRKFVVVR
jgi:photosystem II stability/assembly factor-like uncharacterized protein